MNLNILSGYWNLPLANLESKFNHGSPLAVTRRKRVVNGHDYQQNSIDVSDCSASENYGKMRWYEIEEKRESIKRNEKVGRLRTRESATSFRSFYNDPNCKRCARMTRGLRLLAAL